MGKPWEKKIQVAKDANTRNKTNKETHKMGAAVAPRGVFPQKHLSVF